MHDMAVALDDKLFGRAHCADFGDTSSVIATEIKQHKVLSELFLVGKEVKLKRFVFFRGCAAGARSGDRADCHLVAKHTHKNFGRSTDDLKPTEVEIEHEG